MLLLVFWLIGCVAYGQDQDAPEIYRYHVPLPETFSDEWEFQLEVAPISSADSYDIKISAHGVQGLELGSWESGPIGEDGYYIWSSDQVDSARMANRIQSLIVQSQARLTGSMWYWSDGINVMNGVTMPVEVASELVMPHIPSDTFTWLTRFTIQGISDNPGPGNLIFGYHGQGGSGEQALNLPVMPNGYASGAPQFTFNVGSDDISWGRVKTDTEGFYVAGYQNFLSLSGFLSAALELSSTGAKSGFLGFSQMEDRDFVDMLAVTNTHNQDVRARFKLRYHPLNEEGMVSDEVLELSQEQVLPAGQRIRLILGSSLFTGINGECISLEYETLPLEDEEDGRAIFVTHLQVGSEGLSMGGHPQVAELGNKATTFVDFSGRYKTLIELYSFLGEVNEVTAILRNATGDLVARAPIQIAAHDSVALTTDILYNAFADFINPEESDVYRVDFRGDGYFLIKQTGMRGDDIGLINPFMKRVRPDFKQ